MNKWIKRVIAIVIGGGLVVLAGSRIYDLQQEKSLEKTSKKKKGGARVVSVDLAGHGESGGDRTEWTMQAFGADVAAVAEAL